MAFTVLGEPRVEAKVASDMALIRDEVLKALGEQNVHSILLTGGFGRGEGSVFCSKGQIRIVNDYDFIILPRIFGRLKFLRYYRQNHRRLESLAQKIAAQLQIKQIDLNLKPRSYFQHPPEMRIENYEVRCGHQLLYGDENPCDWMPDWRAEDIPLFEGTWLFRNRGFGLLLARLYLWNRKELAEEDRENFFIECNKAWLAMGDALLLLNKRYHHLYSERLNLSQSLPKEDGFPQCEEILDGYRNAIKWKLAPIASRLTEAFPFERWVTLADRTQRFFLFFESRRLGNCFSAWTDFSKSACPEDHIQKRAFVGELARSGISSWRKALLKANRAQNVLLIGLLLESAMPNPSRQIQLKVAAGLLGTRTSGNDDTDWLTLTLGALRLIHPGGEVERVLRRFEPNK